MKKKRVIFLADCQSFYASVEKAAHPEYRDQPLAVCGDPKRRSGIVLAACPIAKSFGVTTAERIGDALNKCPHLVVVQPRMQQYINVSLQITSLYQHYTPLVEPYSIDEQFLDVTGSIEMFGQPEEIAQQIKNKIMVQTGVRVRVGISENKILAKTSCDNYAKKNPSGIFTLNKDDLPNTLWTLPINNMFMVGSRMTQHCMRMGFNTIGDLARMDLGILKQKFRSKMGKQSDIHAESLWRIANGHDDSPVTLETKAEQKSIGHQMTLPRDYKSAEELLVVLLELTGLVCQHSRAKGYMGWVVSTGVMGADYDRPTGFSRQMKLADPTNLDNEVYEAVEKLFHKHWNHLPVRKVGVTLGTLVPDNEYQITMFGDREKKMDLAKAMDQIKMRYGDAAIMRAVSIGDSGQAVDRSKKIGGHYK